MLGLVVVCLQKAEKKYDASEFVALQQLNLACTFPCDITNCILRIEDEVFNSDGSMTPNFSGTLETKSFTL